MQRSSDIDSDFGNIVVMASTVLHYAGTRQLILPRELDIPKHLIGPGVKMGAQIRFRYTNHPHNSLAILGEKYLDYDKLTVRGLEDLLLQPEFDDIYIFDGLTPLSQLPRDITDYFKFSKNPEMARLYVHGEWEKTFGEIYESVLKTFDLKPK